MKASYTAIPIANCESRFLVHLQVNVIESTVAAFAHVPLLCREARPVVGNPAFGCSSERVDRVAILGDSEPHKYILREDTPFQDKYQSQQKRFGGTMHVMTGLHISHTNIVQYILRML